MRTFRVYVLPLALLQTSLLAVACGPADSPQTSVSVGGNSNTGGNGSATTGGKGGNTAGGSNGGSSTTSNLSSEYSACAALYAAMCKRLYRDCPNNFGTEAGCLSQTRTLCPDILFGDGSQISVSTVVACIPKWQQASCDDLAKGNNPICGFPSGLKALGEPCVSYVECQSLACSTTTPGSGGCGKCIPMAKLGESCTNAGCEAGSTCTVGTCEASDPIMLGAGAACRYSYQCKTGYSCSMTSSTCVAVGTAGARCVANEDCADGLYCPRSNPVCAPLPTQGQACPDTLCAIDSSCDLSTRICSARRTMGQNCDESVGSWCTEGLACNCADSTCSSYVCQKTLYEGEACGAANTKCIQGTECTAGVCVGVTSLGAFKALCG